MASEGGQAAIDIQSKVLQSTLSEVARRTPQVSEREAVECCVICLDAITEACEAQPCKHHNFDYICLLSWLERAEDPRCPLCKAEVKEVRYDFDGPERRKWKSFRVPPHAPPALERRRITPSRSQRQLQRPPRPAPLTQDEALRRRDVYRDQTYSLHVGSNRMSQYRELTPQIFESDDALVSRARMWLRRELKVFEFLSTPSSPHRSDDAMTRRRANNAEFLLEYIIAILKTVDIQGSQGQAEEMLQEFLGRDNTRLLLHELRSFLRSPYTNLADWDRHVQYPSSKEARVRTSDEGTALRDRSRSPARRRYADAGSHLSRTRGDFYRPRYSPLDRRRRGQKDLT